jgi:hypothetical protein
LLSGTKRKIVAHVSITRGVIFARLLKQPNVTKPFFKAGSSTTSGACVGGL